MRAIAIRHGRIGSGIMMLPMLIDLSLSSAIPGSPTPMTTRWELQRFADELDLARFHADQALEQALERVREQQGRGLGRKDCIDYGVMIALERQASVPNANRCAPCQRRRENTANRFAWPRASRSSLGLSI
jgi:RNA polymerase-binding transcription factor DksA